MLEKLVTRDDSNQFEHHVVSLAPIGPLGLRIRQSGVAVRCLNIRKGSIQPVALFKLIGILRTLKPDILQTWLYHSDFLGVLAGPFHPSSKLVWNIRCTQVDYSNYRALTKFISRLLGKLSARPALVIVNSEAGRVGHMRMGYHPRRWQMIPNGFDVDKFKPDSDRRRALRTRLSISDDVTLIGLSARYDPMKDHKLFLQAARMLLELGFKAKYLLVGRGVDETNSELSQIVDKFNLRNNVLLAGEQMEMHNILPGLDIGALASAYGEGFPNILGETMACGVPCVSTDVGDARQIVGDTGVVVPARSPAEFTDGLAAVARLSPVERLELGQRARNRIVANYSLKSIIDLYRDAYFKLVSQRHDQASSAIVPS